MAEDGFYQFAEVGGGEFQAEGAVREGAGFLLGVPALFLDPRRDLLGKAQDYPAGRAALHDAEISPGIFLDVLQIGRNLNFSIGRGDPANARQGEVAQVLAGRAPGDEVPAAHIMHEMEGLDGAGRGCVAVRGVVGDLQGAVLEQRFHGLPEGCRIDHGVFDILDRDFSIDLLQAGPVVGAGHAGHPVDQAAEIVLQRRIGDGRGQADGKRQGQDVGLADPVAGDFEGGVGVAKAVAGTIEFERGRELLAHEFDIAVSGSSGDFEFFAEMARVRKAAGLDPVMKPVDSYPLLSFRHVQPRRVADDGYVYGTLGYFGLNCTDMLDFKMKLLPIRLLCQESMVGGRGVGVKGLQDGRAGDASFLAVFACHFER